MENFWCLDEPFDSLESDRTIYDPPPSGPISGIRVVVVDDTEGDRTLVRPSLRATAAPPEEEINDNDIIYDSSDELENIDETRIYSKSEWQNLVSLMERL